MHVRRALFIAVAAVLACVACVAWTSPAGAHQAGLSQGHYQIDGATIVGRLVFANAELAAAIAALDADGDGALSANEIAKGRAVVAREIVAKVAITGDDQPCPVTLVSVALAEQDGVGVAISAACSARPRRLVVHCGFLDVLPAAHRHIAVVTAGGEHPSHESLAVAGSMDVTVDVATAEGASSFRALLSLGVEHILTGYDHLVFLFGLIVMGGRTRSLVMALTAFTVAHSISLAVAVLGVWAPPRSFVEPAIALSIAYVGVENLLRARRNARETKTPGTQARDEARGRWRITLPFGLVHGFGFAGALAEIGLPRASVPGALLAFNLGVELGQIAVLAAVLPLLTWARRWRVVREPGTKAANVAIVAAGVVWFVLRVVA
jgi:HupE / UreJ protein